MEIKRKPFSFSSHAVRAFEVLECLRKDKVLCDIQLVTDDGTILYGHKVVLASASPYFQSMFTSFEESNKDSVRIHELDSTALKLLVDFIYTAQIMVTEDNVQVLLPAANLLQLHDVNDICCDFLQTQLMPTNCFGIKALADLYGCLELLSSSDTYIRQHFAEVIECNEYLSLSSEQVTELISSDELTVPSEETVFESVISWVNHDSNCRKDMVSKLMKHVRLPLVSKKYLFKRVQDEPLLNESLECKNFIIKALNFHLFKSEQPGTIPKSVRTKARKPVGLHEVILVVGGQDSTSIEWYDPATQQWQYVPEMSLCRFNAGFAVLEDQQVFAIGGRTSSRIFNSVDVLDISSSSLCWVPTVPTLTVRYSHGVGVLNNDIYAVGGCDSWCTNSAEVFDCSTKKWRKISSMSTRRLDVGVGVLNNILYVVGGYDGISNQYFRTVECYQPSYDTWKSIAEMYVCRRGAGVGVLNDVLYAVGGRDQSRVHKSVEAYRPSAGVWTYVSDMHMCRKNAGVVAFDGLLYVVGGNDGNSDLNSVEIYNPHTNTWSLLTASMNIGRSSSGVFVINKPTHFNN